MPQPTTKTKWHLMFSGVASTPDYSIRVGETFKDALNGELICTFPETTTRTAEKVRANANLMLFAREMVDALEMVLDANGDLNAINLNQIRDLLKKTDREVPNEQE